MIDDTTIVQDGDENGDEDSDKKDGDDSEEKTE